MEPYNFDNELKFLVYKLIMELKQMFGIFCNPTFTANLRLEPSIQQTFDILQQKHVQKVKKSHKRDSVYSLRVYTALPKEIKFTPFLLEKLAERFGQAFCLKLIDCLPIFLELSDYLLDFSYVIDEISYDTLS